VVLRTFNLSIFEIAKWIGAILTIAAALWVPGMVIATALWIAYGQRAVDALGLASAKDIERLEGIVADTSSSIHLLARQVTVLSQPENITLYRDLPIAVEGFCVPGEACAISIFAERDVRAIDCRVIAGRTEMLIISQGREYVANATPNRPGTNLSASPRALEPTFVIPSGIQPGPARAIIRAYYTECPWQVNGQPPAIQDSPTFPLTIVAEEHQQ
jgi:hypothetical protein